MEIREAAPGDVESLQRNCFSRTPIEQLQQMVADASAKAATGESALLVAHDGAEVVGTVTVSRNEHRLQRHRAHLGGFVIHPSAQGKGLARRFTAFAANWALERGCEILELNSRGGTPAEGAYRGLGFQEWGRLPAGFVEEEGTFDQVCFYLRISDWLARE